MQSWGRRPNAGGAGLEPVARGRAGAGLGLREARISAHAPFPAASSSTTATLGSFLYANRSCQKRSRDPPRGGAAWPAPSREGAGAGGELVPWNPTRTPGGPRAARTSALSCLGLHPFPCVPLRFPCPNSHWISKGLRCAKRLRTPCAARLLLEHHSCLANIPLHL